MNIKALGLAILATVVIYLTIYYIQLSFFDKTPVEIVSLFKFSTFYFLIACVVCLTLLELMKVFVPDQLALGFLVLMMVKLGGFVMVYMNGPELPKWIRLMLLAPMFVGIFIEVIFLYKRINASEQG